MKKNGAESVLLAPDSHGWRIGLADGTGQHVDSLEAAAGALPGGAAVHLALPCGMLLLERLSLPSTDREELAGMVQLQLEKTLPYPVEEVTSGFEVIRQEEAAATVVTLAVHTAQLDQLCAPLRAAGRLPGRVSLYASIIAAGCPAGQTVLCLWPEGDQISAAVCENGKVASVQGLAGLDSEALLGELPAMLLRLELEGVPVEFSAIRLERACEELKPALEEFFQKPVEVASFVAEPLDGGVDLRPAAWMAEQRRLENTARLKQRLQSVAFVYLLLIAGAFVYLAWVKMQVRKLDAALATTLPQLELIRSQQARWGALQPAINPDRYPVEVLLLTQQALPSAEVKFNTFEYTPKQFMIEGEAASANLAIEFGEKLRAEPALGDFKIETGAQKIVKDDRAKFTYFGKL